MNFSLNDVERAPTYSFDALRSANEVQISCDACLFQLNVLQRQHASIMQIYTIFMLTFAIELC